MLFHCRPNQNEIWSRGINNYVHKEYNSIMKFRNENKNINKENEEKTKTHFFKDFRQVLIILNIYIYIYINYLNIHIYSA